MGALGAFGRSGMKEKSERLYRGTPVADLSLRILGKTQHPQRERRKPERLAFGFKGRKDRCATLNPETKVSLWVATCRRMGFRGDCLSSKCFVSLSR